VRGRDFVDQEIFQNIRDAGFISSVEPGGIVEQSPSLIVRFIKKGLIRAELTLTCLPGKGYSYSDLVWKMGDLELRKEENRDFVQTPGGIWLPLRSKSEAYTIAKDGSLKLVSRIESVAVQAPQLNVPIDSQEFVLKAGPNTLLLPRETRSDPADHSNEPSFSISPRLRAISWALGILTMLLGVGGLYLKRRAVHSNGKAKSRRAK